MVTGAVSGTSAITRAKGDTKYTSEKSPTCDIRKKCDWKNVDQVLLVTLPSHRFVRCETVSASLANYCLRRTMQGHQTIDSCSANSMRLEHDHCSLEQCPAARVKRNPSCQLSIPHLQAGRNPNPKIEITTTANRERMISLALTYGLNPSIPITPSHGTFPAESKSFGMTFDAYLSAPSTPPRPSVESYPGASPARHFRALGPRNGQLSVAEDTYRLRHCRGWTELGEQCVHPPATLAVAGTASGLAARGVKQ